jgi:DNA-binding Lrp family transcriptional regulator
MSETKIDKVDKEIIRLLQEDAELSAAAVGERGRCRAISSRGWGKNRAFTVTLLEKDSAAAG